jgi:hypothetical protein
LSDEVFPDVTAMIDDIVVGLEDPVSEPVVAKELPEVLILSPSKDRPG